jgi:two-component system, sensor histidine kinase RegB
MMFHLEPTITLPWLVRLRWLFVVGQGLVLGTLYFGFGARPPWWPFALAIAVTAVSNLLMTTAPVRRWPPARVMGSALLLDTALLTVQLAGLGGATNPFTVMYFVYITLSAVVLSARWTTVIALFAIGGFASLFAVPAEMHVHHTGPALANPHLQGMWAAFVLAAALTAFFVRKISRAIALQREQIATLREASQRNARLASLATLAAGAAHELNTPLSTIAIAAYEAALRAAKLENASSVRADLDLILEQVDRCQRIIHQMAARANEPEASHVVAPAQLVQQVREQLGDRAARVEIELAGDARSIAVPADSVVQSAVALIKNALDASDETVRVEIRCSEREVSIVIEDRGPGIPSDVLARIGEPFFTTKAPGRGLGLGVFLARLFFESRGGNLSIESGVGTGTRARARMPVEVML